MGLPVDRDIFCLSIQHMERKVKLLASRSGVYTVQYGHMLDTIGRRDQLKYLAHYVHFFSHVFRTMSASC